MGRGYFGQACAIGPGLPGVGFVIDRRVETMHCNQREKATVVGETRESKLRAGCTEDGGKPEREPDAIKTNMAQCIPTPKE